MLNILVDICWMQRRVMVQYEYMGKSYTLEVSMHRIKTEVELYRVTRKKGRRDILFLSYRPLLLNNPRIVKPCQYYQLITDRICQ